MNQKREKPGILSVTCQVLILASFLSGCSMQFTLGRQEEPAGRAPEEAISHTTPEAPFEFDEEAPEPETLPPLAPLPPPESFEAETEAPRPEREIEGPGTGLAPAPDPVQVINVPEDE